MSISKINIVTEKLHFYQLPNFIENLLKKQDKKYDFKIKINVSDDFKKLKDNRGIGDILFMLNSDEIPIDVYWKFNIFLTFEDFPDYDLSLKNLINNDKKCEEELNKAVSLISYLTKMNIPNFRQIINDIHE